MRDRTWTSHGWLVAALSVCLLAGAPRGARADVSVALLPAVKTVPPGSEFDVYLDITQAGSAFNGYSAVLSYDPNALTLVASVPLSLQEGCLMTGACSAACGNTFHQFLSSGDSLSVNDYLFCNQVALTGPGDLYRLRFRAANRALQTTIGIRRATFYNAGLLVAPVATAGMTVQAVAGLAVGDDTPGRRAVRVEPNPAFGRMQFVLGGGASGLVQADVLDLQGRVVRHFGPVWSGPNARLEWDGADSRGSLAPGGVYLARIRQGGRVETTRFVLLR